jgi:hypothetical protein
MAGAGLLASRTPHEVFLSSYFFFFFFVLRGEEIQNSQTGKEKSTHS